MGTKDILDSTLPVRPSQRRELQRELDFLVFSKDKSQKPKDNDKQRL